MNKTQKAPYAGFTIIELLVIVAVIGILAAAVLNSYAGSQDKAKTAAVADGLTKMEKAFINYAVSKEITQWPDDGGWGGYENPTLSDLSANTDLKDFISSSPEVKGMGGAWHYDHDTGSSYDGCSNGNGGVNIMIADFDDDKRALMVDELIDDGNLNCGKFRKVYGTHMRYNIDQDSSAIN